MKNFMTSVRIGGNRKNWFELTHDVKMSMKFGYLYPTLAAEVLPGETFKLGCESVVRFAPMVFPTMHRFKVSTHYFFVPNRICWPNWEKFITHNVGTDQVPATQPVSPYLTVDPAVPASYLPLMDYMGVPLPQAGQTIPLNISALPYMAYQLIWDNYFRQDFVIPSIKETFAGLIDGDNNAVPGWDQLVTLRKRAWQHDYFTSCLPTPQHGLPVEIPFVGGQDVPVQISRAGGGTEVWATNLGNVNAGDQVSSDPDVGVAELYVAGDQMTNTATIEDLRRASAIQRFFERIMRAGRRYKEILLSAFGTDGGDARLDRPEFIFSVHNPVIVSEVLNTSDTASAPQGALAGHGVGLTSGNYGSYKSKEHGWIIAVMSVLPETGYENGLWGSLEHRDSYLDYFWDEFANLGEEAVPYSQIFAYDPIQDDAFGYLPRYSRYRTMPNRVAGQFRTTYESFHFGRKFTSVPGLNQAFIECTPGKRIFAVTDPDVDELQAMIVHKIQALRPVPKYGTPSLQ